MTDLIFDGCRLFYGVYFLVFGLDGIFHFLPAPKQTETLKSVVGKLVETKFILPTVKFLELTCGLLFLFNIYPRLALILIIPIVFGICFLQILFNRGYALVIILLTLVPGLFLCVQHYRGFIEFILSR